MSRERKHDFRYSGPNSERFWERVNALPNCERRELYACGVLLQEMESRVLAWLAQAEQRERTPRPRR